MAARRGVGQRTHRLVSRSGEAARRRTLAGMLEGPSDTAADVFAAVPELGLDDAEAQARHLRAQRVCAGAADDELFRGGEARNATPRSWPPADPQRCCLPRSSVVSRKSQANRPRPRSLRHKRRHRHWSRAMTGDAVKDGGLMAKQNLGDAVVAESNDTALTNPKPRWVTLPSRDDELPTELRRALDDFDAGERPAAQAAGSWLQTQAVAAHQTSRTRLLIAGRRVAASTRSRRLRSTQSA